MIDQPLNTRCDKCNEEVADSNNVLLLELVMGGDVRVLLAHSRHLLPHWVDGSVVCPGSPSRAQYLPGRPRDTHYAYTKANEEATRAAYAKITTLSFAELLAEVR